MPERKTRPDEPLPSVADPRQALTVREPPVARREARARDAGDEDAEDTLTWQPPNDLLKLASQPPPAENDERHDAADDPPPVTMRASDAPAGELPHTD